MSYFNMDHTGWVESNIASSKRMKPAAAARRRQQESRGWLAAPDQLNPFQRRAIDIFGIVGNGIYNAPISWDTFYWSDRFLVAPWSNPLATFDFTALSKLVFLCHEARIRGEIRAKVFHHIEISLGERVAEGGMPQRHPNLDEAISQFREDLGAEHPIRYAEPTTCRMSI